MRNVLSILAITMTVGACVWIPDYVVYDLTQGLCPAVLKTPAAKLVLPFSKGDLKDIRIIEAKFDQEKNMAGLAAPQLGISKQIIIFAVPDDPELKKFRPDLTQSMPKTIWINPTYEPVGDEMSEDWEACFSVANRAGLVKRYKKIRYTALTVKGDRVEGEAEGFLARTLQHEMDHVKGRLYIDLVPEGKLMSLTDYRKMREEQMRTLP